MGKFIVNGGRELKGEISVSGSKNCALPILFSLIAVKSVTKLYNLPKIKDVELALKILVDFGAKIIYNIDSVIIDTTELEFMMPNTEYVSQIRASTYLLGACLCRFGYAYNQPFGGCNFSNRPIDYHLMAFSALGAEISGNKITLDKSPAGDIYLPNPSVGATVNSVIASLNTETCVRIFGYAKEPHVVGLIDFLNGAGADISITDEALVISGGTQKNSSYKIIPDMIEAGTYSVLSLMFGGNIKVTGADAEHLGSFFHALTKSGASIQRLGNDITVSGKITRPLRITTGPYPSFPTDLQPQFVPLMAMFLGGQITETVFEDRFGYLSEFEKLGLYYQRSGSTANIFPSKLKNGTTDIPDLRAGAALVMSALRSEGESVLNNSFRVIRGYSDFVNKLRGLGADITEVN